MHAHVPERAPLTQSGKVNHLHISRGPVRGSQSDNQTHITGHDPSCLRTASLVSRTSRGADAVHERVFLGGVYSGTSRGRVAVFWRLLPSVNSRAGERRQVFEQQKNNNTKHADCWLVCCCGCKGGKNGRREGNESHITSGWGLWGVVEEWCRRTDRNNRQRTHSRCTHARLTLGPDGRPRSYPSVCAFDGFLGNMGSFPSVTHACAAREYRQIYAAA